MCSSHVRVAAWGSFSLNDGIQVFAAFWGYWGYLFARLFVSFGTSMGEFRYRCNVPNLQNWVYFGIFWLGKKITLLRIKLRKLSAFCWKMVQWKVAKIEKITKSGRYTQSNLKSRTPPPSFPLLQPHRMDMYKQIVVAYSDGPTIYTLIEWQLNTCTIHVGVNAMVEYPYFLHHMYLYRT